jgi:hypothetical protein
MVVLFCFALFFYCQWTQHFIPQLTRVPAHSSVVQDGQIRPSSLALATVPSRQKKFGIQFVFFAVSDFLGQRNTLSNPPVVIGDENGRRLIKTQRQEIKDQKRYISLSTMANLASAWKPVVRSSKGPKRYPTPRPIDRTVNQQR